MRKYAFIVDEAYSFYGYTNLIEYLKKQKIEFGYYYYDPTTGKSKESIVNTARNIRIGDYIVEVLLAYGEGVYGTMNTSSVFYKEIGSSLQDQVAKQCVYYLHYSLGSSRLYFYFDDAGKVSFIVFSYDEDVTSYRSTGHKIGGHRITG